MTNPNDPIHNGQIWVDGYGLTKREYFAAMAMQAYITRENMGEFDFKDRVAFAVMAADALIKELSDES